MKCKNCKESMNEIERDNDDGLVMTIWECEECNWKCQMHRNIDPEDFGFGDHESWMNEKGEVVDW